MFTWMHKNLFHYEGDGSSGEGGGSGEAGGSAGGSGGSGGAGGGSGDATERKFSQADVDRFVQERLARDRKDRLSDEEIQALRDKAAAHDAAEEQNKTELQKAIDRAEAAEKARDEALTQAGQQLIASAILAEGAAQGAVRPEHLVRLIDTGTVTVGNDGQVAGAKEAVEAFLKGNPEYVGSTRTQGGGADQGARGGSSNGKDQLSRADLQGMSSADIVQAERDGRLRDLQTGAANKQS